MPRNTISGPQIEVRAGTGTKHQGLLAAVPAILWIPEPFRITVPPLPVVWNSVPETEQWGHLCDEKEACMVLCLGGFLAQNQGAPFPPSEIAQL